MLWTEGDFYSAGDSADAFREICEGVIEDKAASRRNLIRSQLNQLLKGHQ